MSDPRGGTSPQHPAVGASLRGCRHAFWSVALFSGLVNILMLAGPLYMLQVYDRVLASQSVPTLLALSLLLFICYLFQAILDLVRSRVVVRIAALLDRGLGATVHDAVMRLSLQSRHAGDAGQPLRDLDQIRGFLSSPGPIAIVDLPWIPIFLFVCFLIHPVLGYLSLGGAVVLFAATILTERASRGPMQELIRGTGNRLATIDGARRNSETVAAMGLSRALGQRWSTVNDAYLGAAEKSGDVTSFYGSFAKVFRLLMQSAILGVGAYLVIRQELSPGGMIAASIMMARALAPVETAIANWRGFIGARGSVKRLSGTLARLGERPARTALPAPCRSLSVEGLTVIPPGGTVPVLANLNFRLAAGEILAVLGPSGAGKTSLVRALVGIWRPVSGTVRLDGAALDQWDPEQRGRHVGYLSQNIELFDGTIAENIARMALDPPADAVIEAARAAGAHDMILRLPNGYDTAVGDAGAILSGGQRQRLALARALYGRPFLVVLDEPNASLDQEGEVALVEAVRGLKSRGAVVVLITHRSAIVGICDKVLMIRNSVQQAFGPRESVLRALRGKEPKPAAGDTARLPVAAVTGSGVSLKIVPQPGAATE